MKKESILSMSPSERLRATYALQPLDHLLRDEIDAHLSYVVPPMLKRGGWIPSTDHGCSPDVSLENFLYYRKRICEMDH